jgi:glycosyl transferase family 25
MKLIDQFERIYIVNLPERSDRRREMEAELGRYAIAVDGAKIRYLQAVRPDDAGLFPSLGSRGCFLSHLAILNHAVEDDLDNVLVMEDDLSVDQRFAEGQSAMCQTLQQGKWHFAYFGHVLGLADDGGQPVWQEGAQPIATTHFYALNRPVIRPLRDYLEACLTRKPGDPIGGPMHVDGAYSLFRKHHPEWLTLIATPSLGGQRSSRSDIFPNKWYDRTPLFAQIAGSMRTVKNLGKRAAKPK